MKYENLPIYKSAMDFCVYIKIIVKGFEKYHKYTLGVDLRNESKALLFLMHRANIHEEKSKQLEQLRDKCEDVKMLIQLCKELKAFSSFKQFEHTSKLIVEICKQSQAWLNHYARVAIASVQQNIVRWSHPLWVYSFWHRVDDIFILPRQVDHLNPSDNYWSSSVYVSNTKNAWIVNFKNGNTNNNNKTNENYVRCVRGR